MTDLLEAAERLVARSDPGTTWEPRRVHGDDWDALVAAIAEAKADEPLTPEWFEANEFVYLCDSRGVQGYYHRCHTNLRVGGNWTWFYGDRELPNSPQTTRPALALIRALTGE